MVLLHPDGGVEVIDLLARPEGLRLLVELTADSREPNGQPTSGNVVRPPILRVLPRLPLESPSGRPVLVEDGPGPGAPRWIEFSPREYEVLELIVEGLSNQEIAQHLYLGINTIKSYVRTTYRKIRVTKRSQAVRWGLLHGLGHAGTADQDQA